MKSFSKAVAALSLVTAAELTGCQSHEEKVAIAMQNANRKCDFVGTLVRTYSIRPDVRAIIDYCNDNAITAACRRSIATNCTPLESDTHLVREAIQILLPGASGPSECQMRLLRQTRTAELQSAETAVRAVDNICQYRNLIGRLHNYATEPYLAVENLLDTRAAGVASCPNSHIPFNNPFTNTPTIDTTNRFACYLPNGH